VDYRETDGKIYIHREDGKEHKCSMEERSVATSAEDTQPALKYQQGTITGWTTRVDTRVWGGGNNSGVSSNSRRTRVYALKSADMVYQIDDCGSFQTGQFRAGQTVVPGR
jgi:hypothetical protein